MCLLAIILLFTSYYWLTIGYLLWYAYDLRVEKIHSRGGRRSEWVRHHRIHHLFRDYFPIHLIKTAELDPNKNYIMGTHPHGIIGCSIFCNFASEATGFSTVFPGIKPHLLTLRANFYWPVLRAYTLWMGICDVSKESIEHITTKQGTGNAAVIVVGGAQEALEARPENYVLTLKRRQGFVRMALKTGSSLVPVFSFGENDLYYQPNNPQGSTLRKFQETFKRVFGFTPPLFYGRGVFNYSFGVLPRRKPCYTIVGSPIELEKDPNPSQEVVDKYHALYMEQLSDLFDEHKEKYGVDKNVKLTFT